MDMTSKRLTRAGILSLAFGLLLGLFLSMGAFDASYAQAPAPGAPPPATAAPAPPPPPPPPSPSRPAAPRPAAGRRRRSRSEEGRAREVHGEFRRHRLDAHVGR